jgi:hypothetical protein
MINIPLTSIYFLENGKMKLGVKHTKFLIRLLKYFYECICLYEEMALCMGETNLNSVL